MGFLSFHLNYYEKELQRLECDDVNDTSIYHARQLLKILDDLLDEGYTALNDALEASCRGVSRLRAYLQGNGAVPFPTVRNGMAEADASYTREDVELTCALGELVRRSAERSEKSASPFLPELIRFCEWVGYEEDTAYVFLLRDTLLPYLYYQQRGRARVHPWLLGRRTLQLLTGKADVDDALRAAIIRALEVDHCTNYDDLCRSVLPGMRDVLRQYPTVERYLAELLSCIGEKRIVVVESGCSGTFPMLLRSLDTRVEVRMYTTYPYLLGVYGERIYSPRYEDNRRFETLCAQDVYLRLSDVRDGRFYVSTCIDPAVRRRAYAEVKAMLGTAQQL